MNNKSSTGFSAHNILNVIWGSASIVLLISLLYFVWYQKKDETTQQLYFASERINDQISNLITDFSQSIIGLTIDDPNLSSCSEILTKQLNRITLSNPRIAALVIKNNQNQIICSTIPGIGLMVPPNANPVGLFGPVGLVVNSIRAYVFEKQVNPHYTVQVYFLEKLLEQALKINEKNLEIISLFDGHKNEVVFQVERDPVSGLWRSSASSHFLKAIEITNSKSLQIKTNVKAISGFEIILTPNTLGLSQMTLQNQLMAAFFVILIAFVIYYPFQYLINQHCNCSPPPTSFRT